jgi:hypothetical protein
MSVEDSDEEEEKRKKKKKKGKKKVKEHRPMQGGSRVDKGKQRATG